MIAAGQRQNILPSVSDSIVDGSNSADKVVDTETMACVSNGSLEGEVGGKRNLQSIKLDPSTPEQTLLLKIIILLKPLMNPLILLTVLVRVTDDEHKTNKPTSTSRIVTSTILEAGIEEIATKGIVGRIADLQKLVHQAFSDTPAFELGSDEDLEIRGETLSSSITNGIGGKCVAQDLLGRVVPVVDGPTLSGDDEGQSFALGGFDAFADFILVKRGHVDGEGGLVDVPVEKIEELGDITHFDGAEVEVCFRGLRADQGGGGIGALNVGVASPHSSLLLLFFLAFEVQRPVVAVALYRFVAVEVGFFVVPVEAGRMVVEIRNQE